MKLSELKDEAPPPEIPVVEGVLKEEDFEEQDFEDGLLDAIMLLDDCYNMLVSLKDSVAEDSPVDVELRDLLAQLVAFFAEYEATT